MKKTGVAGETGAVIWDLIPGGLNAELFCAFTLQNVILTYDLWPVRISRELSDLLFLVLK